MVSAKNIKDFVDKVDSYQQSIVTNRLTVKFSKLLREEKHRETFGSGAAFLIQKQFSENCSIDPRCLIKSI